MSTLFVIINFAAVLIGVCTIIIAYKMSRNYGYPYINNFFYFVVFSVIAGFFDWTVFNLIIFSIPNITIELANKIYHIFWDIIGFPASLAALYFLAQSMTEISDIKMKKRDKALIIAVLFAFSLTGFLHLVFENNSTKSNLGILNYKLYSLIIPLIQLSILIFGYIKCRTKNIVIGKFILLLLAGYIVWYIIPFLPAFRNMWGAKIALYYTALLIPTLYLYFYLKGTALSFKLDETNYEKLEVFLIQYDFTDRERDIIKLLYEGKSNKGIEEELFISMQTVKNYVSRIYKKLNVKNRLELVNFLRNKQTDLHI
jgi:DNA-binding CsgD family transcriptional regulator